MGAGLFTPFGVVERKHLYARATKPFNAVATAAHDEQAFAPGVTVQRCIERE